MTLDQDLSDLIMVEMIRSKVTEGLLRGIFNSPRFKDLRNIGEVASACKLKEFSIEIAFPDEIFLFLLKSVNKAADEIFANPGEEERGSILSGFLSECLYQGVRYMVNKEVERLKLQKKVLQKFEEIINGGPAPDGGNETPPDPSKVH